MWGRSSAGRASRSQCGGREFDPPRLHQFARLSSRNARQINVRFHQKRSFKSIQIRPFDRPLSAYSVEKLCFSRTTKFIRILYRLGPQVSAQLSRSELRQDVFSCGLHHPLVSSVRKTADIANEKSLDLKTEFFNSIGRKLPFISLDYHRSEWSL